MTLGERQRIGTVNNCTCQFFTSHHSACKHMFLVARRTKFRVVEQALDAPIQPDNVLQTTSNQQHSTSPTFPVPSNSTGYRNSSGTLPTSQAMITSQCHDPSPPQTQPLEPSQPGNEPPTSLPNFSLQSFLRMAQGLSHQDSGPSPATTSWAQQLHRDGLLQPHNRLTQPRHQNNQQPQQLELPLTSTPFNPADVHAEDLNVYWEDSRTSLPIQKFVTKY